MRVEGSVPLEVVVWLTESDAARTALALAAALPSAEWMLGAFDRARLRLRGSRVDVEAPMGQRWTGLVEGRVRVGSDADAPPESFEPYALELSVAPMVLKSCWFAVDRDERVACFDRDQLGAAPMKRCWGPRREPPATRYELPALLATLAGHHAPAHEAARGYTFVADASSLADALGATAPQAATRRWSLAVSGARAIVSAGWGTVAREPVAPAFIAWLHAHGLCLGCARSPMSDARAEGVYVYQSQGRDHAAPYERVIEPHAPWTVDAAANALGLSREALVASALPVRFSEKARLQPVEYVPCTWSDTVPWESEAGERHGAAIGPGR